MVEDICGESKAFQAKIDEKLDLDSHLLVPKASKWNVVDLKFAYNDAYGMADIMWGQNNFKIRKK